MTNEQERVEQVLQILYKYWMEWPELSLGEIIFVAQTYVFSKYPEVKSLFYIEDWQFKEAFGEFFEKEGGIH
jgi:hypothetical protein